VRGGGGQGVWVPAMTHEELVRQTLDRAFGLEALLPAGGAVVLFALVGLFSARALRCLPDCEHKREMLWGARWYWAVFVGVVGIAFGMLYFGVARTPYLMTSMCGSSLTLFVLTGLSLHVPRHQSNGAVFSLMAAGMDARGKPFDLEEWLERQRDPSPRTRRIRTTARILYGLLPCLSVYAILAVAYPVDRMGLRMRDAEAVGRALGETLPSPLLWTLDAFSPVGAPDDDPEHFGSLRCARRSVRQIAGLERETPPTSYWGYWAVFIRAKPDAIRADRQAFLAATRQYLQATRNPHYWYTTVRGGGEPGVEKGTYGP